MCVKVTHSDVQWQPAVAVSRACSLWVRLQQQAEAKLGVYIMSQTRSSKVEWKDRNRCGCTDGETQRPEQQPHDLGWAADIRQLVNLLRVGALVDACQLAWGSLAGHGHLVACRTRAWAPAH